MANVLAVGQFYPRRLSEYVPALQYCVDVHMGGGGRVSFGSPVVATASYLLAAQSIAVAGSTQASGMLNNATLDAPFGRNITIILSGAGAPTVTIDGWDYLGQPMSEQLTGAGAVSVAGNKCFKYIRQITWTLIAATTMNFGCGAKLGLPYRAIRVLTEESNSALVAALGTLITPDLTVPATLTTNDTRGQYTPTTVLDGAKVLTATFEFANDVDASNNGGLHGVPHFAN